MAQKTVRPSGRGSASSRPGRRSSAKSGAASKPSVDAKPIGSVEEFAGAAECLKTLAHPVRLRMVQLLLSGKFTVGQIAKDCGIPDNVASEHLRLLQRCRFLDRQKEGRCAYYTVVEPHLKQLMGCIESRFLG
ncbi:MAG: metalloregulator ArsR/SmtB family transcription factor [Planctomycetota bacterium]